MCTGEFAGDAADTVVRQDADFCHLYQVQLPGLSWQSMALKSPASVPRMGYTGLGLNRQSAILHILPHGRVAA